MGNITWSTQYRPKRLKEVCGQETAVSAITGMLRRKQVPSALMFSGPSGVGKTTLARMVAMYVNCDTGNACGKCASCKMRGNHPDITELNAAEARGIDDVRQLIQKSKYQPRFKTRVFILDEIQGMTPQSLQALLIPFESSPPNTMWCICTTDPQKLPATMLTRCTKLGLDFPTREDIAGRLRYIAEKEQVDIDESTLLEIADASGGHVRESINILQNVAASGKDALKTILASSNSAAVDLAQEALLGIYSKQPLKVIKPLFASSDNLALINQMLWFNQFVLGVFSGSKPGKNLWFTPQNKAFLTQARKASTSVHTLLEAHHRLVAARNIMHTVSTSELALLIDCLTYDLH